MKTISVRSDENGFVVLVNDSPARTPKNNPLTLPTRALAERIAAEWHSQQPKRSAKLLPFTRLANTAIDLAARDSLIEQILKYGSTDLLLYRGDEPALAARQQDEWDPLLDWMRDRFNAHFIASEGITPIEQPRDTMDQLRSHLEAMDSFALVALSSVTTIMASLILALSVAEGRLSAAEAFSLSQLDERYQAKRWGLDRAAEMRAQAMTKEVELAAMFLSLSRT